MRIALIGTRGVPARYGGFETAVEEVGRRLAARGHDVVVFCRGASDPAPSYAGMTLVHLPAVKHRVAETLSHTALSVMTRAARDADAAIIFNAANAPLLPVMKAARVPTAVHVDGLEWKRSKWGALGRRYYLTNERLACRWADLLIADAVGIQDYYTERYAKESTFIPYGAPILDDPHSDRLQEFGLSPEKYHLVVARFEPENHVHAALEAYIRSRCMLPLVVVGSAPYSEEYVQQLHGLAARSDRVRMIGAVWDQELLDALYAGSVTYIHGHSVGGTNPSLLRAMGAGAAVLAFDVNFNREVLAETGRYWGGAEQLAQLLEEGEQATNELRDLGRAAQARASAKYTWSAVTDDYERLCERLVRARSRT